MVQGSPVATQSPHMWRFCAPHSPSAGRADSLSQSAEMVASANSDGRKSRISHSPKYFSVSRSSVLRISAGSNGMRAWLMVAPYRNVPDSAHCRYFCVWSKIQCMGEPARDAYEPSKSFLSVVK